MAKMYYQHYSSYLDSKMKRCFDIFACLLLPPPPVLMLPIISAVILVVDGRPGLFFQRRVGKNGGAFILPKIRTLKIDAHPNKPAYSYETDAFITKTGKFLRRHRFDELPQLFSVLMGKMTLVGPRPELPDIVKDYSQKERKRLCVRPGLTGLWQIRASRTQPIHKNIRYTFYYLRKATLWLDIRILAETISFVLKAESEIFHEENQLHPYSLPVSE